MPKNREKAGFDLTFGNPPWRVPTWNSGAVIGDFIPSVLFRGESAPKIREALLKKNNAGETLLDRRPEIAKAWRSEFEESIGTQLFLGAEGNYPEIKGSSINLFKLFLPLSWRNASKDGVQGFVHPLTNFSETNGLILRRGSYQRIRYLFQFQNELLLFPIHDQTKYTISIYGNWRLNVDAKAIMNLFHPKTIDETFSSTDSTEAIGIKDENGNWNIKGQKDRLITLDKKYLKEIGMALADNLVYPVLPNIHSESMLKVLGKYARIKKRIRDLGDDGYCISSMWHESGAQKDGTIVEYPNKGTKAPADTSKLILNGPHLNVGNPYFKTPLPICNHNLDWSCIDLELIPNNYIPRAKYKQMCSDDEYVKRQIVCKWDNKPFDRHWRIFYRGMVGPDSERSLAGGVYPIGVSCVNANNAIAIKDFYTFITLAASFAAVLIDGYVRQFRKVNLLPDLMSTLPLLDYNNRKIAVSVRLLCLNCLTLDYAGLWKKSFNEAFKTQQWTKKSAGLNQTFFANLTKEWKRTSALRSDLSRRQALLELDVLTSQAMGFELQDLLRLYRIRFRVLRNNEANTWYDQNGRIVFTTNAGLPGVGLPRTKRVNDAKDGISYRKNGYDVGPEGLGFEDIQDLKEGVIEKTYPDVSMTDTPVNRTVQYVAPFFKMDREKDYAVAWKVFEELYGKVELPEPQDPVEANSSPEKSDESSEETSTRVSKPKKPRKPRAKKTVVAKDQKAANKGDTPPEPDKGQESLPF